MLKSKVGCSKEGSQAYLWSPSTCELQALLLLHRRLATCEEQHLVEPAVLLVLLNLSFVYLKLDRPAMALRYGEQALLIDKRNAKALFRCGQVS